MKALVVGCGSIGRRHIENLARFSEIGEILVLSRRRDCLKGLKTGRTRIDLIEDIDRADAKMALICNETADHLSAALPLARRGVHLFIEKPISHSSAGVRELEGWARRRKITVFVAYNMRFLGAMKFLRHRLKNNRLGRLMSARIEVGQYLPHWRPRRDWRQSYSVDRARGGGVSLDLSHELDYMRCLFGDPMEQSVLKFQTGRLRLKAEDTFEGVYRYPGGFLCSVHLDCLQNPPRRTVRIAGEKGFVECDFLAKRITIGNAHKRTVITDRALFDFGKSYVDELRHFIRCVQGRQRPLIGIRDGVRALELGDNEHV